MPITLNQGISLDNKYRDLSLPSSAHSFSDTEFSSSPNIADSMVYDLFGGPVNSMRSIWSDNNEVNNRSPPTRSYSHTSYEGMDNPRQVHQRPLTLPALANNSFGRGNYDFMKQIPKGSPPYSDDSNCSNTDYMYKSGGHYLGSPETEGSNVNDMLQLGGFGINNGFRNRLSDPAISNIGLHHGNGGGFTYKQTDNFKVDPIWSGELPQRIYRRNTTFSCKVFLGGLPWDITEDVLIGCFSQFGTVKIEWPGKEGSINQPKGYVYLTFENEQQVKGLLDCCCHDYGNGGSWYYRISSRRMKSKEVQVIPWALNDSNYVVNSQKLDPSKTVFVGALHGMINAQFLFKVFNEMFGGVIYAGIDTDKNKYPIGSGRVTFANRDSYMKAVQVNHIVIKTSKFTKKIQVDPYVEDSPCSTCKIQQGPYFCREPSCFRYYCRTCWTLSHILEQHRFITRCSKHSNTQTVTVQHM